MPRVVCGCHSVHMTARWEPSTPTLDRPTEQSLALRLARFGPEMRQSLAVVYGEAADDTYRRLEALARRALAERPADLRRLDEARLLSPDWLQQPRMVGYVCYTDRFAGTLRGVTDHLDHLDSLGVTYLHLMPLLKPRPGENDGGYAVADYRSVRPDLGTMADLSALAAELRARGISLVVDLVLNHVTPEHEWAVRARAGEQRYRDYFLVYPDREVPDAYERTLPEVFPDFAPGNFTWDDDLHGWVWTTFNAFQWDLNWANPDVLLEMAEVICFLANAGVEVLRLDAIAFIWKRLGTTCQNQPEVHHITRVLRSLLRVVAPAVAFKAEAIVGPDDLITYLGVGDQYGKVSDAAYHNALMVHLWSAVASRDTRLLRRALERFPAKPTTATWATYVRCHDDIGWAISDEDAEAELLTGPGHRGFCSDFFSGQAPGSYARGLVFQHNPETGDRRISGSLASLAGLESALEAGDGPRTDDAVARILLLHAAMLGFGGVPLLYSGDEIAALNDHAYTEDPEHAADNRWVHRPRLDWAAVDAAERDPGSPAGRVLSGLRHLVAVRKVTPHLHASVETQVLEAPHPALLVFCREHPLGPMVQVYNVGEVPVTVPGAWLRDLVRAGRATELVGGHAWDLEVHEITVAPLQVLWLVAAA